MLYGIVPNYDSDITCIFKFECQNSSPSLNEIKRGNYYLFVNRKHRQALKATNKQQPTLERIYV